MLGSMEKRKIQTNIYFIHSTFYEYYFCFYFKLFPSHILLSQSALSQLHLVLLLLCCASPRKVFPFFIIWTCVAGKKTPTTGPGAAAWDEKTGKITGRD
jgi:hypothetical protein